MQLNTALTIGAVGLRTALVSSFTCPGPVAISPRFAYVSQHPYRQAVDSSYPLRTPPLCVSPKAPVEESDETLLTPETYATSQSAENEVKHIIMDAAVEAFQSTDFTTEPHLPPELESCEVIYDNTSDLPPSDSFQRSLLAQQFAYNTKKSAPTVPSEETTDETPDASKKQEAFQRSLLAARLSNNDTTEISLLEAEEEFLQKDSQMNWMESEVRAASFGAKESLPFHDSAAMATRSADLADAENTAAAATTSTASTTATDQVAAAKKKIGITPVSYDLELAKTAGRRPSKQPVDIEIQSYVTKKGVEITKERMRKKLGVDTTDNNKDGPANEKGLVVRKLGKEDSVTSYLATGEKSKAQTAFQSALQKLLQTGLVKRFRQPKVLIASILLAVLCRSLALAWFGNPAMRLKLK